LGPDSLKHFVKDEVLAEADDLSDALVENKSKD
jgi:hypothetical protein